VSPCCFCVLLNNLLCRTEPLDNILSFLITIGAPALAAYSLQVTHLNTCWATTAFKNINHPNSRDIATVLSAFHNVPIRISTQPPFLHSPVVLHKNDKYWRRLLVAAKKTRRSSIPVGVSFALAIFATILTILDSVHSPRPGDIGYAIAAAWAFLLPLVIGWLYVGSEPETNHLRDSLHAANRKALAAARRGGQPMKSTLAIEFTIAEEVGSARKDELKTAPVFNYSRAFTSPLTAELVLGLMKNAPANAEREVPVGNLWEEGGGDARSDEHQIETGAEVTEYSARVLPQPMTDPTPTTPPDTQSPETTGNAIPLLSLYDPPIVTQNPSRWATGVWKRVGISAVLALGLQWGTTGAAVLIHYVAPPAGLGCRALSFLLYGVAGTISFLLFLVSSILAHMSRPHQRQEGVRPPVRTRQNDGAIICRRLGKGIAIISAVGVLLVCFFQISGGFNNCFCTSTTFDKGSGSVVFLTINYVIGASTLRIWIGGLAMAFSTALLFGFLMCLATLLRRYLFTSPVP